MGFQPSLRDLDLLPVDGPALRCLRENWVVPPGLRSFFPLFPALKRWAKLVRPSGAAFSSSSFHRIAKTSVLTHTEALAEKVDSRCPAPKGASDFEGFAVSIKRYRDTKPEFFRKL